MAQMELVEFCADSIGSVRKLASTAAPKYLKNSGINETDASTPLPKLNTPVLEPKGMAPNGLAATES